MKEILNFELCKRLYEVGIVKVAEKYRTEKEYTRGEIAPTKITKIPKVTIVDGLELIKYYYISGHPKFMSIMLPHKQIGYSINGENLKSCVEKALTYLLDNNLLTLPTNE